MTARRTFFFPMQDGVAHVVHGPALAEVGRVADLQDVGRDGLVEADHGGQLRERRVGTPSPGP